jgi:adenylate cyclase
MFVRGGLADIVCPPLALAVTYVALTVHAYLGEERQRTQIKETSRQYVAPLVVEEMLKDPGRLRLGGEEKALAVLFSDLEGFTTGIRALRADDGPSRVLADRCRIYLGEPPPEGRDGVAEQLVQA